MHLAQDPETEEFGERARRRREAIARMQDPVTSGPPLIDTAVQYYGEKAKGALFGDLDKTIRTVAFVGLGLGLFWFLSKVRR